MNDGVSSHSGIPRSAFPDGVPTFSGHFHKPHTIGDGFIRYVGSPYQVREDDVFAFGHRVYVCIPCVLSPVYPLLHAPSLSLSPPLSLSLLLPGYIVLFGCFYVWSD